MKFKITRTVTKIIENDLHDYYHWEELSEDDILEIEKDLAEDDPDTYLEGGDVKTIVERID